MYGLPWSMLPRFGTALFRKAMPYNLNASNVLLLGDFWGHPAWSTPKEILLESIEWPSLRWRREVLFLCLFFKLLNFRPEPLGDILFPFAKNRSTHSLRKPLQLLLPLAKSTRYVKSFFYRSALLWNSLPHSIQSLTSAPKFRMALENHWHLYKYKTDSNIPFPCT